MKYLPMVSIIIPTRKISNYLINENFPAINQQTYKNFEVIVLSNSQFTINYPWLHIIHTGKITRPAEKRNIGAKKAQGEILAFLDDDAYPDKHWLTNAFRVFRQPLELREFQIASQQSKPIINKIEAICGPGILPEKANFWEKVFDEILKSYIGSGGLVYRFTQQKQRYVNDYPSMNFFIRKKTFMKLGGFNKNYWPGEDSKLCNDLVYKEKGKILYDSRVLVYHHRRNRLIDFLYQHANYGFHRGAFFAHGDRNSRQLTYLIPTFFIFYIFLIVIYLLFTKNLPSIFYLPSSLYLLVLIYIFITSFTDTKNFLVAFTAPFVLFLTHFIYGIMFLKGFLTGLIKKDKIY